VAIMDDPAKVVGAAAVTEGVRNYGAGGAHVKKHLPHSRHIFTLQNTQLEATTALQCASMISTRDLGGIPTNSVSVSPSVRGASVYVTFGQSIPGWVFLNNVWYPTSDYIITATQGTQFFKLPTRENWVFSVLAWSVGQAAGYADQITVVAGYLPDNTETAEHI